MALVQFSDAKKDIGVITLNDPNNLNAMGEEMAAEFAALVNDLRNRSGAYRALILTGSGRAFSAGGNLDMLEAKTKLAPEENRKRMLKFYHSFLDILELRVPLIAAVNGAAIGAGLCVASACDIRIAAKGAKLGFTFTKLALHPGMGATYFLPRVVGVSAATELMLTGRVILAEDALRLGLVSRVVEPDAIMNEVLTLADEVCQAGPECVRQLLGSLRSGGNGTLEQALEREALCQSLNYASDDFLDGVRAMREKRAPKFASN